MPLSRPIIATLARLALGTQIRAYERENRKPERGEARRTAGLHFLHAGFQQSVGRARALIMATLGPRVIRLHVQLKRRSPDGGVGASSVPLGEQGDGREAVTGPCIALGELRTTPSIMNILT
jgi:hypothetical protein